jgi:hypothetical protein
MLKWYLVVTEVAWFRLDLRRGTEMRRDAAPEPKGHHRVAIIAFADGNALSPAAPIDESFFFAIFKD